MTTPVLFLDDASRHVGTVDRGRAEQIAMTLLATLKRLRRINNRIALNTLRPIAQYQISDDWTLQAVLGGAAFKEEWDFVRGLSDRSPFSAGLEERMLQEIGGMEFRTRPGQVSSRALAWAARMDTATVGFAAHPDWAQAWVEATYVELDDDGNLCEAEVRVKNASQVAHADTHAHWLTGLGLSADPTAAQVWDERGNRFPGLRFLPRVRNDLVALEGSGGPFLQALAALKKLASYVASWKNDSPWPDFPEGVTPEASRRKNLCRVHDDMTGAMEPFDWHIYCVAGGWPGRVHFRVDGAGRSIVVAYIGRKLTQAIAG